MKMTQVLLDDELFPDEEATQFPDAADNASKKAKTHMTKSAEAVVSVDNFTDRINIEMSKSKLKDLFEYNRHCFY